MTKETKVKLALDKYLDIKKQIENLYNSKFNELPVNDFGEVKADSLLDLNCWHTEQLNKAENDYVAEIKAIFEQ